jgi:hypothetical protein
MFIPEPTDLIPILGWLDEATAFTVLIYALGKLNIKIPNIFKSKSSKNIITID